MNIQNDFNTIVDVLEYRARITPNKIAYSFLEGDNLEIELSISYIELHTVASKIAQNLLIDFKQQNRMILFFPPGISFIKAFFGCLYAGMIPVPSYPPKMNRSAERMRSILSDSKPSAILTESTTGYSKVLTKIEETAYLKVLNIDEFETRNTNFKLEHINPEKIAFLQYTSGSTGNPKGVMVNHVNLMDNLLQIKNVFGLDYKSILVGWLPAYHDMGLVGNILQAVFSGFRAILFAPVRFLKSPKQWVNLISKYKATVSGGPNFSYELCCEIPNEELNRLNIDLSSWKVAFNGAEPIILETLNKFSDKFKSYGFQKNSFLPCYGMAETTLLVSGVLSSEAIVSKSFSQKELQYDIDEFNDIYSKSVKLVSSGEVARSFDLKIIRKDGSEASENSVGEIYLNGPSVASGYWKKEKTNKDVFENYYGDKYFFRTGDLALISEGYLYITGRLKDLIIINGKNYYPQDIESKIAGYHDSIVNTSIAAFSVKVYNNFKLLIVAECQSRRGEDSKNIIDLIQKNLALDFNLFPYDILLIRRGTILKTSSGKIQRNACKKAYLNKQFRVMNSLRDEKSLFIINAAKQENVRLSDTEEKLVELFTKELKLENKINKDVNFLDYGLDSIVITRLMLMIESVFEKELEFDNFFTNNTISLLAKCIEETRITVRPKKVEDSNFFLASQLQKSIFIKQQQNPANTGYHIPLWLKIDKKINVKKVEKALIFLINKYDVLRSVFELQDGAIYQRIRSEIPFKFDEYTSDNEFDQREYSIKIAKKTFDLEKDALIRSNLIHSKKSTFLMIVIHHILLDARSVKILVDELKELFQIENIDNSRNTIHNNFNEFCIEESQYDKVIRNKQKEFWLKEFDVNLKDLNLPKLNNIQTESIGGSIFFTLDGEKLNKLNLYLMKKGVNLFSVLITSYFTTLHILSGTTDLVVGVPISLRDRKKYQKSIGLFINTLMFRGAIDPNSTFSDLVNYFYKKSRNLIGYSNYPFQKIIENKDIKSNDSELAITKVFFNFLNNSDGLSETSFHDFYQENFNLNLNFDLNLYALPSNDKIQFRLDYDKSSFSSAGIENIVSIYEGIVDSIISNTSKPVKELTLNSFVNYPEIKDNHLFSKRDKLLTVWEKFSEVVNRYPDKVSIKGVDRDYSYTEVFDFSNSIAKELDNSIEGGLSKNIGLCFTHHENMIFSMLASLKLGYTYVPVDFSLPNKRKRFILQDSGIDILLTDKANFNKVISFIEEIDLDIKVISIDKLNGSNNEVPLNSTKDSLAYILYTSGSTGTPKGVIQDQSYIMHIAYSLINSLSITNEDCISLIPTFNFSASMMDVFAALLSGASLKIIDIKKKGFGNLVNEIKDGEVSIYHSVPSVYRGFVEELVQRKEKLMLNKLRYVYLAGEPLLRNDVEIFKTSFKDSCILVNALGCTEFNVCSQYFVNKSTEINTPYVPLGYDGIGVEVVLFDDNKNIINGFGDGEIVIKSNYLSKGYWNLPELTEDRFITISGDSYYFTGDLGRRLPDGRLVHLGRKDFQIKLRGQRIELGEIESQLQEYSEVRRAVVVAQEINNTLTLCAYLLEHSNIDIEKLKAKISKSLPKYMLPQYYTILDDFPLTISGKVDRKSLPAPKIDLTKSQDDEIIFTDEKSLRLREIWSNVLKIDTTQINGTSDFFALGGDSLKAIQILSRIRDVFSCDLSLDIVFNNSSFNEMIDVINSSEIASNKAEIIPLNTKDNIYEITSGQQSVWLYSQFEEASLAYNLCGVYKIEGKLNIELLKESIFFTYQKYDILRASFENINGETLMKVNPIDMFEFDMIFDAYHLKESDDMHRFFKNHHNQIFNLSKPPLGDFRLLITPNEFYLSYRIHHIIADGWSSGVIIKDILSNYNTLKSNTNNYKNPNIQFQDYASWLNEKNKYSLESEEYWLKNLHGFDSEIKWVNNNNIKVAKSYKGEEAAFDIEQDVHEKLKTLSESNNCTMFMTVITLLGIYFKKFSGNNDIILGTDFSGRNSKQIEDQIGYFLKLIPVRLNVDDSKSVNEVLKDTKTTILNAFQHQDYPIENIIENLKKDNNLNSELFNVLVLYQNFNNQPNPNEIECELKIEQLEIKNQNALIDLTFEFIQIDNFLRLKIRYKSEIFEPWQINAMFDQISYLFNHITEKESLSVDQIQLHDTILINQTEDNNGNHKDCNSLFNTIIDYSKNNPNKTALICADTKVKYEELHKTIQVISNYLVVNTSESDRIGVLMNKDEKAIITLLSILYSGRVFVPLDVNYPEKRLKYIVDNSGLALIITDTTNNNKFESVNPKVTSVNYAKLVDFSDKSNDLTIQVTEQDLAYIFYTSGTTGLPKGVMISRDSLAYYVDAFQDYFKLTERDHVIQQASLSFDTAIEEIFPILSVGGTLDIIVEGGKDIQSIIESIEQREATVLSTTPLIINELNTTEFSLNKLEKLISGGDVLKLQHADKLFHKVDLFNTYGPTETTVCATYSKVKCHKDFKIIGKEIKNKKVLILDGSQNILPSGIIGEIVIGGKGLFEGYVNQESKTDESFIIINGLKFYKTGDLGYLNDKEELIFIGRRDHQIKIRGQRINLNETSFIISTYKDGLKDSYVLFDKGEQLIKGYLSFDEKVFDFEKFYKNLKSNLPQYMIPSKFYALENLPYSLNGKVDVKKLQKGIYKNLTISTKIILPNNETQKEVLIIWQKFLKLENISIDSNFFLIGGDSLLLGKIKMELEQKFSLEIDFKELFELNTILLLSNLIDKKIEGKLKNSVKQFII